MSMFARSDKSSESAGTPGGKGAEPAAVPPRGEAPGGAPSRTPVPSLIGAGLKVKGNLETAGEIQVDGEVEGDVRGKSVTVGEGAVVKGSVFGDQVIVSGTIEGKVEGMTVTVQSTARLTGDIVHETVKIDQGAYVDGRCSPQFGKAATRPSGPAVMTPASKPAESQKADPAAPGKGDTSGKGDKGETADTSARSG